MKSLPAVILLLILSSGCTQQSSCTDCPLLSQPSPDFCINGTIIPGIVDECGCQSPPSCEVNETVTQFRHVYNLPSEYEYMLNWSANTSLPTGFMSGNTFMDYYSDIIMEDYINSTLDSMLDTNAEWVAFDNFWSHYSLEPVIIGPFTERVDYFRDATDNELGLLISQVHAKGKKFALMLSLNFDVMRGEWQSWEYQEEFNKNTIDFIQAKANELENPTNETNAFWDSWFSEYSKFVLDQAQAAEAYGADMLVIGHGLEYTIREGNKLRWSELINKTREVYKGPVSFVAYTMNGYSEMSFFPCQELDYLIIYQYNEISTSAHPSLEELKASFEAINENQLAPLSEACSKEIILLTPYQSRDYGAKQEWFEPSAPAPNVGLDLVIQAQMYEALMQSLQDEEWIKGVWTWGYWWRDDYNTMFSANDSSYEKSSSVRNKPAMAILAKWNKQ